MKTALSSCRSAWSRSRRRRGRRPHEVFGFASNVLIIDGELRKTFGRCSTLKRASRSLAKTGFYPQKAHHHQVALFPTCQLLPCRSSNFETCSTAGHGKSVACLRDSQVWRGLTCQAQSRTQAGVHLTLLNVSRGQAAADCRDHFSCNDCIVELAGSCLHA